MALRTVFMALCPFLLCFDYVISTHVFNVRKHRQARTLIYPPTAPTRLQVRNWETLNTHSEKCFLNNKTNKIILTIYATKQTNMKMLKNNKYNKWKCGKSYKKDYKIYMHIISTVKTQWAVFFFVLNTINNFQLPH